MAAQTVDKAPRQICFGALFLPKYQNSQLVNPLI